MGGITEAEKVLLFSVLEFLAPLSGKDGVDAAKVQAGVKSLQEAFNVNPSDAALKQRLGLKNHSLLDIFTAGSKSLQLVTSSAPAAEDPVIAANPGLWQKWLAKLEAKGFFNGVSPGTSEYDDLYKKALSKFKEKFGNDKAPPSLSKEEKEAKAETLKASGNAALSAKDYAKAEQLYSEAIALSPAGPNSHIYLSNLAAAQMYLEKYDDVVDNCEKSIELNPKYVKAYSRLGAAYLQLEDIDLAIDAFSRGLEVDPTNDMCKSGLHDARNRQSHLQTRNAPPPAGGGGMPDLSALAGMMGGAGGGAGGLAGLMSNPAMQQMAAQMMQNPQMMAMAQNMMKDPAALSRMMGSMGGGGGGGGAPDLSSLLTPEAIESFRHSPQVNAMRGDPVMAEFFDDMDQGGPQAAMRHMSNPAVAAKLQGLLSNNMM